MPRRFAMALAVAAGLAAAAGCCPHHWKDKPSTPGGEDGGASLELTPQEARPIAAVEVADAAEVALLVQEVKLEPVRREGSSLIYVRDERVEARLEELGYEPRPVNPHDTYRRVVRVDRRGEEDALPAAGVRMINREEDHWVVEGSLAALRGLRAAGYRLRPLARELRPREIRVLVAGPDDVRRIAAMDVDVFNVDPVDQPTDDDPTYDQRETGRGFVLYGTAYDAQIDQLEAAGFEVERVDTTPQGGGR
jgi:hypothetical protein